MTEPTVLPILGVRHPQTSQLFSAFLGVPGAPSLCSYGRTLSDLVNENRGHHGNWKVCSEDEIDGVVDQISREVGAVGAAFFAHFATLEDLRARLASTAHDQVAAGHLAIAEQLSGHPDAALRALERFADATLGPLGISPQVTRFSEAFRQHFDL
ncbi:hypothetical protein [Streptodolium elevatio]